MPENRIGLEDALFFFPTNRSFRNGISPENRTCRERFFPAKRFRRGRRCPTVRSIFRSRRETVFSPTRTARSLRSRVSGERGVDEEVSDAKAPAGAHDRDAGVAPAVGLGHRGERGCARPVRGGAVAGFVDRRQRESAAPTRQPGSAVAR